MDGSKRDAILASLQKIVGPGHVLTDPALFAGALIEPRGLYHGKTLALVRPAAAKEVAAIAALCNEARIGIVPQGGNTGLVGGQTPDLSGEEIILSTQRLRAIREVDLDGDVMICEAGVTLAEAQAAALAADRLFPLSLASEGSCTIGGNVSTNAGGVTVVAYGNTRDLVTGVEAVLADGRIVNGLSKLRKDNTGYDVKGLFIGAEGTLGVVTAASLRLFPNPRARATAFVGLRSPEDALKLLRLARERLGHVTSFELIGRNALDITVRNGLARKPLAGDHPWCVLMEAASQTPGGLDAALAEALEAALEGGIIEDASIAASLEQRAEFWRLRESIPEAQVKEGASIKHDVSVEVALRAGFDPGGDARGRSLRARRPRGRLRPSRRRQHPFQRLSAGRRRPAGLSRPLGRDERNCARDCRPPRRLIFGRARRRSAQARAACPMEGSRLACGHAPDQGDARSERGHESGQGAVKPEPRHSLPITASTCSNGADDARKTPE